MSQSEVDPPEKSHARVVFAFLQDLCASTQYGILYKEPSVYIPPNQHQQAPLTHNPRVLSALHFIKPADHTFLASLALSILSSCPALKRLYVDKLKIGLDPRPTLKWLANIRFVQKLIVDVPLDVEYYATYLVNHSTDTWGGSDRVVSWIVPNLCSRQILTSSVLHADRAVCYAGLLTCCDIVETCRTVVRRMAASSSIPAKTCASLLADLVSSFRKRVPDLQTLLTCLRKLEQPDQKSSPASALSQGNSLPLLETMYKLLRLYVEQFAEAFVEARFDFGKLMAPFSSGASSLQDSALLELLEVRDFFCQLR